MCEFDRAFLASILYRILSLQVTPQGPGNHKAPGTHQVQVTPQGAGKPEAPGTPQLAVTPQGSRTPHGLLKVKKHLRA